MVINENIIYVFEQTKNFSNEMDLRTEPILHSQDIADYQDISHKGHAKMNYYNPNIFT